MLQNEIQQFSWQTFKEHVRLIPTHQLLMSFGMVLVSYFILTFYDKLALYNLEIPLSWYKAAKASFLGFAFSHNITPSLLVGGTIRYRIYYSWGLSGFSVTKLVGFCAVTLWFGFMTLCGLLFALTTVRIPEKIDWPLPDLQILGWIFIGIVIGYLILCRTVRASIVFRGKIFSLPSLPVAAGQVLVSSLDLISSSLILYFLLPPNVEVTYPLFLSIYLIGFIGGIVSQVPGGLGIIEIILVLMLGSFIDASRILSAVLVYRLFYFIIPLMAAAIILAVHEIRQKRKKREKSPHTESPEPV